MRWYPIDLLGLLFLFEVNMDEEIIQAVFKALSAGADIDQLHEAMVEKGYSEEEIFLAIKAGENLYDALLKQHEELKARPLPFGRKL